MSCVKNSSVNNRIIRSMQRITNRWIGLFGMTHMVKVNKINCLCVLGNYLPTGVWKSYAIPDLSHLRNLIAGQVDFSCQFVQGEVKKS